MHLLLRIGRGVAKFVLAAAGALVVLAALAILPDIPGSRRFSRYRDYPDKSALLAAESNDVVRCDDFTINGTNVTIVLMNPCRWLASGCAMLVYDAEGKLIDKTKDEGDDGRFQQTWSEAWRKSLSEKTRRWLRETRLPEVHLAAPATMAEFAAYMEQASKDFDRPGIPKDKRGIRFRCCQSAAKVVFPGKPKDGWPIIETLPCGDMSFWDALTNACGRTGCAYRVYDREVDICNCK